MAKAFVNQHIVPKRYLDRFASEVDGKNIIGVRFCSNRSLHFFSESTSNVGYIRNFYDVRDKDDPKYWEHFFASEIDSLCGAEMDSIIAAATLSRNNEVVLTKHAKEVLSKVIIAQIMRIPSAVEYVKGIYPEVEHQVKEEALSILPTELKSQYGEIIKNLNLDAQWQKEQLFNFAFSPENFDKYCRLLQERLWVVLVNTQRSNLPFVTSDNPVLVEGIGRKEVGVFRNGLGTPTTCIFYPLTPTIAIANYPKAGFFRLAFDDLDGRKKLLNESNYVVTRNARIVEQSYHHSFIPQPLFDKIKKRN